MGHCCLLLNEIKVSLKTIMYYFSTKSLSKYLTATFPTLQQRLAIQISLKCTLTLQIFIDPHWYFILDTGLILRSIELSIYIQTNICVNFKHVRFGPTNVPDFTKNTTLSFHLMHVYNSVHVSVLLLYYKTIDISE
jgi:hypothetical protein